MYGYKVKVVSDGEIAEETFDVLAKNFSEAQKKTRKELKDSCLCGRKRVFSITEIADYGT